MATEIERDVWLRSIESSLKRMADVLDPPLRVQRKLTPEEMAAFRAKWDEWVGSYAPPRSILERIGDLIDRNRRRSRR